MPSVNLHDKRQLTRIAIFSPVTIRRHGAHQLVAHGASGLGDFAWRDELKLLWEFAQVLEAGRGKPSDNGNRKDYNFVVDWSADCGIAAEPGKGRVVIDERQRGGTIRSQGSGSSMSPVTQMRRQGMSVGTDREEKLLVTVGHSFEAKGALAAAGRGRKAGRCR